ncbi:MAG: hypothetical protein WAO20_10160 [Acidobacteriota bacterium]
MYDPSGAHGFAEVRLLTNHPKKLAGLEGFEIKIVEQIPIQGPDEDTNLGAALNEAPTPR